MCGIAGLVEFENQVADLSTLMEKMGDAIRHRGPDASGVYSDSSVGLVHRRLSIIDLNETGSQPMSSPSGRFVIVFNGEIYNFKILRSQLEEEGISFNGTSDTEVLIALYEKYGSDCLSMLNGMFAIAVWDKKEQSLFLARDRLGKKPLYYYYDQKKFLFASEIKAILCDEAVDRTLRSDAIKDYFFYQYVPDPKTIFKNIQKLRPGHWLRFDRSGIVQTQYWDLSFVKSHGGSQVQIEEDLVELLDDSVKIRMVSDVPLGAFLSGGVDSSAIVGLMAKNSPSPIITCSIGFDDERYNEIEFARKVANQFKTNHHEFIVQENIERNLISIATFFDEPFADPSFIPTYYVSQLASSMVSVALAGDGGDENFAGYSKYLIEQQENRVRKWVPGSITQATCKYLSRAFADMPINILRRGSSLLDSLSGDSARGFFLTNSFFKNHLWERLITKEFANDIDEYETSSITREYYEMADTDDHLDRILYTDIKSYLPGDILTKVDRMSMANSLETRAPILDYRVVEFAASIPSSYKIKQGEGKSIFKSSMEGFLSDDTLYRKKMGFSVPLADWLRNEISVVAEKYLLAENSGLANYFKFTEIEKLWLDHKTCERDHSQELWSMLVFEIWWQKYVV